MGRGERTADATYIWHAVCMNPWRSSLAMFALSKKITEGPRLSYGSSCTSHLGAFSDRSEVERFWRKFFIHAAILGLV